MSEGARQPGRSHPSADDPSPPPAARRTEPTDAVEAELSGHRGAVLHREKFVSRALAASMALGALLFALAGVGALASERGAPGPALLVPFVVAGLFALTGLTKPVLRTTVTDREVYALHGLRESRVPLASVTSVTVVPATRQSLLGAEALGPAAGAQMVLVAFDDVDGASKKRAIPSVDPAALAAILEEACGRARAATGVRAAASVHEPSSVASETDDGARADEARRTLERDRA